MDVEVFNASMPRVFHLHLCFEFPDHRFNERPLFQQPRIGHRYVQGFHVLTDFVNQV